MKICQKCGKQNKDFAKFCNSCGNNLENTAPTQEQLDFNPNNNSTNQQQNNNSTNQQQNNNSTNQQQNTYQPNYQTPKHKNAWIAIILNIIGGLIFYFLCGIGQLYLGLYKRGLVICAVGLIPVFIGLVFMAINLDFMGTIVSLLLGVILIVYSVYDAYQCTAAINEGRVVPLLFGFLDLQ